MLIGLHNASGQPAVFRYTQAGVLDSTFGTGGVALDPDTNSTSGSVTSLAVLPDGRIIAAASDVVENHDETEDVFRLNSDGFADTTFGTAGYVTLDVTIPYTGYPMPEPQYFAVSGLIPQNDGRFILVGPSSYTDDGTIPSLFGERPLIIRYNTDGSIDSTFDQSVDPNFAPQPYPYQMVAGAMQSPDGSLFIAANVYSESLTGPHIIGVADYVSHSIPVVPTLPASMLPAGPVVAPPSTPITTPPASTTSPSSPTAGGTPISSLPAGQLIGAIIGSTPAHAKAGAKGVVTVQIRNAGKTTWKGPVTIAVYASTDATLSADDLKLASLTIRKLALKAGRKTAVRVPFVFAKSLTSGHYVLLASVTETSAGTAAQIAVAARTVAITAAAVDRGDTLSERQRLNLKSGKPD